MKKKKQLLIIAVIVIALVVIQKYRKFDIEGTWTAVTNDGILTMFDFNGNEYLYYLSNGGISYGEFRREKDRIVFTSQEGESFTYGCKKSRKTLTITANNGEFMLTKDNGKIKLSELQAYDWAVEGTSQRINFTDEYAQTVSSSNDRNTVVYELKGYNNEILVMTKDGITVYYYITCKDGVLRIYDEFPDYIEYYGTKK